MTRSALVADKAGYASAQYKRRAQTKPVAHNFMMDMMSE